MTYAKIQEKNLWSWLSKIKIDVGKESLWLERIEQPRHPDVDGAYYASAFKIELKTAAIPAKKGGLVRVQFEPGQLETLKQYTGVTAKGWLLVQLGGGTHAKRYLIRGDHWRLDEVREGVTVERLEQLSSLKGSSSLQPFDVIRRAAGFVAN